VSDRYIIRTTGQTGPGAAAGSVTVTPTGGIAATNLQSALAELDSEKATVVALNAHLDDADDAHDASAISLLDSAGYYAAATVEAAFAELPSKYGFVAPAATGTTGTDVANLQAAITAAAGKGIIIPAGSYSITALSIPADTSLFLSRGCTLTLANSSNTNLLNVAGNNVTIEGHGKLNGNRANQSGNSNGVYTISAYTTVRGITVTSCNGYNIVAFPGASDFRVDGCISLDARDEGIEVQGCARASITNNLVRGAGKNGIYVYANTTSNSSNTCTDVTISGNIVEGSSAISSGYANIRIDDRARNVTVTGNTVSGGGTSCNGIVVHSSTTYHTRDCAVTGNTVRNVPGAGIQASGYSQATVISGNSVQAAGTHGIYVTSANTTGVTVTGNTVSECTSSGIMLLDTTDFVVEGNICRNNGQGANSNTYHGITLWQSTDSVNKGRVAGNRCYDDQVSKTQQYGIRTLNTIGASVSIGPNILDGNGTSGMLFSFGGATAASCVPWKLISNQSVSSGGNSIAHGLPYTPQTVLIFMRSAGTVYRAGASDGTSVVLASDSGTRTCDILVG